MRWSRPSTTLCAFVTLLNDRLGESIVFPLLPFLLATYTSNGRTLGLLAGSYAVAQFTVKELFKPPLRTTVIVTVGPFSATV